MINTISVRNVNEALPEACRQILLRGIKRESHNGPVLQLPGPLITEFKNPRQRVLFSQERDANPYFHLFEAIWMLAGSDKVEFVARFNSNIKQYSDDGRIFHGAYGYRWACAFGMNQPRIIADNLQRNRDCRRQVLQMWSAELDMPRGSWGRDVPCNTQAYFQMNEENKLVMMVTNRSNDLIWGAYGANVVHFSILQEYIAAMIDCEVGPYYQCSFNTHLYTEKFLDLAKKLSLETKEPPHMVERCPYALGKVVETSLFNQNCNLTRNWKKDAEKFISLGHTLDISIYEDKFFCRIAIPMMESWQCFKREHDEKRYELAKEALFRKATNDEKKSDWLNACWEWIDRRERKAKCETAS